MTVPNSAKNTKKIISKKHKQTKATRFKRFNERGSTREMATVSVVLLPSLCIQSTKRASLAVWDKLLTYLHRSKSKYPLLISYQPGNL
jgi:hypothetical protein